MKKRRQRERAAAAAAAAASSPAAMANFPAATAANSPAATAANSPAAAAAANSPAAVATETSPRVLLFLDSNLRGVTPSTFQHHINNINTTRKQPTTTFNIETFITYELRQTLNKIRHTTINQGDIVILNIMTNDARQTKHRHPRTLHETYKLQHRIINILKQHTARNNIIILESPPLLNNDIYAYNRLSYHTAKQFRLRFAYTLVGEQHLWDDGVHVLRDCRHLLISSVAAAIIDVDPHSHFELERPPKGVFGPWTQPFGFRPAPSRFPPPIPLWRHRDFPPLTAKNYSNVAAAPAFYYGQRQPTAMTVIPLMTNSDIPTA